MNPSEVPVLSPVLLENTKRAILENTKRANERKLNGMPGTFQI